MSKYILCEYCKAPIPTRLYTRHIKKNHKDTLNIISQLLEKQLKAKDRRLQAAKKKHEKNKLNDKKVTRFSRKAEKENRINAEKEYRIAEEMSIKSNAQIHYIIWDDIFFEKDKIKFSTNRTNSPLQSIEYKGVF